MVERPCGSDVEGDSAVLNMAEHGLDMAQWMRLLTTSDDLDNATRLVLLSEWRIVFRGVRREGMSWNDRDETDYGKGALFNFSGVLPGFSGETE